MIDLLIVSWFSFLVGFFLASYIERRRREEQITHFQSIINSLDEELSFLQMDIDEMESNLVERGF